MWRNGASGGVENKEEERKPGRKRKGKR